MLFLREEVLHFILNGLVSSKFKTLHCNLQKAEAIKKLVMRLL